MANIRQLTPELAKCALENLGENPNRLDDDISAIRSWIEKQAHLIPRTDDQFIITFLRSCKFSLEETKKRIEAYFTCKTIYPELFRNRPIDEAALDIIRSGLYVIAPKPLPNNGPRLFISQFGLFDPKRQTLRDIFKVQFMLFELLAFEDDETSVNGLEHIFDLKNCTFQQVLHFDPVVLKKTYIFLDQGLPVRIGRVHIINLRKEFQATFKFARNVLPSDLPYNIIVHEDEKDLLNYIPQDLLTAEYGGKNGTKAELVKELEKKFEDHAGYFEKDAFYGTNEKLRQGQTVSLQSDFGVEGSFRKLEID